jgi:predicted dehydrogenase
MRPYSHTNLFITSAVREQHDAFPQEMGRFVECVLSDKQPPVSGQGARIVMETILAANASGGWGEAVESPFAPWPHAVPVDRRLA